MSDVIRFVSERPRDSWRVRWGSPVDGVPPDRDAPSYAERIIALPGDTFRLRVWPAWPLPGNGDKWIFTCRFRGEQGAERVGSYDVVSAAVTIAEQALETFVVLYAAADEGELQTVVTERLTVAHLRFLRRALDIPHGEPADVAAAVIFRATGLRIVIDPERIRTD